MLCLQNLHKSLNSLWQFILFQKHLYFQALFWIKYHLSFYNQHKISIKVRKLAQTSYHVLAKYTEMQSFAGA